MKVDEKFLLVIGSDQMGDGEIDLGQKLMQAFLKTLLESGRLPDQMIFMNSGIFLTTEGSPVEDTLRQFEKAGTKIRSCGTCLAYYDRKEKLLIGETGNMKDTVGALLDYEKIIQL